jgi:DNA-binding transcriptional ArsR family regulator
MIRVDLDAASVARVRVTPSPIFEVVSWLAVLATGARHPVLGDSGPAARFALRYRPVAAAATLVATCSAQRYLPDLLTPKPAPAPFGTLLNAQIDAVAAVSPEIAQAQLPARARAVMSRASLRRYDSCAPTVLAGGLRTFWHVALADQWSVVDRALDNQVREFGTVLASGGVAALFDALPGTRWTGGSLHLDKPHDQQVAFRGEELVVMPSLLTAHPVIAQVDSAADATLGYLAPARAVPSTRNASSLLGRGRTAVLAHMGDPATTRELARRLKAAESTVSHHLQALTAAGLATRERRGQSVVYQLTELGHGLRGRLVEAPFSRLADLGRPQDRVVGVEITVSQMIAHGGLNVGQPLPFLVGHSSTNSRSARARTAGFRSLAGTRSTLVPRMASSSSWTRPSPSRPISGGKSTSRSTSLSGRSSPRATLPKTRIRGPQPAWAESESSVPEPEIYRA